MKFQIPLDEAELSELTTATEEHDGKTSFFVEDAKSERISPPFSSMSSLMEWKITRGLIGKGSPMFGKLIEAQRAIDNRIREERKHRHV